MKPRAWFVAVLILVAATRSDGAEAPKLEARAVAEGIFVIFGPGGNVGVSAGGDGVLLIDDQVTPVTDALRAVIVEKSKAPIRFVVNTHWHFDHTGGNEALGASGVVIVAHDAVRERMSTEQFVAALDRRIPPSPEAALPLVTFGDRVTFHWNGDEIEVFHVDPAHTDGDAVVRFHRANVVHTGDLFFNGLYPFIDGSSGGSLDGMIAGVDRVLEIANEKTVIIPGHGPLARRGDLEAYRALLSTVRDRVGAAIEDGKSVDDVVAMAPTAEFDEKWGGGFLGPEAFVRIVYALLGS